MSHADYQSNREKTFEIERFFEYDLEAMLAALRVVLGLPRVIPILGPDDLIPDAT